MNRIVRCLSLLAVGLASILPVHAVPVHRDVPWCGTNRFGLVISDALHRQHERRLARERTALGARDKGHRCRKRAGTATSPWWRTTAI